MLFIAYLNQNVREKERKYSRYKNRRKKYVASHKFEKPKNIITLEEIRKLIPNRIKSYAYIDQKKTHPKYILKIV